MRNRLIERQQGFTLVEVLAATLILAIALVPLLGLFTKGASLSASGWFSVTVASLAQGEVERLKRVPFRSLADEDYRSFDAPCDDFERRVEITEVGIDQVEIKITVRRLGGGDDGVFDLQARRTRR